MENVAKEKDVQALENELARLLQAIAGVILCARASLLGTSDCPSLALATSLPDRVVFSDRQTPIVCTDTCRSNTVIDRRGGGNPACKSKVRRGQQAEDARAVKSRRWAGFSPLPFLAPVASAMLLVEQHLCRELLIHRKDMCEPSPAPAC